MSELTTEVKNSITKHNLCELVLWGPPQGTIAEAIPISIDLDFDAEQIQFSAVSYDIRVRKATIQLRTTNADVVRGSRLGELTHDLQITAETTQSVREALELETHTEGHVEIEISQNVFGKLVSLLSWKTRKSKKAEKDHIIKSAKQISRIVPRTAGRWSVVEPISPHILSGRFIGSDGKKDIGPLCLLTMRTSECSAQIVVTVNQQDLEVVKTEGKSTLSKNKTKIINQMILRSIPSNQVSSFKLPPKLGLNDIILAHSVMEIRNGSKR